MRGLLAVAVLSLAISGCKKKGDLPKGGDPEAAAVKVALTAVDRLHEDLKTGNTAEICRSAKADAFPQSAGGGCESYFATLKEKLGPLVSATRAQLPIASQHPARVGVEYDARFEKGSGREHFQFLFSEGQPQLTSYRLNSDQLR